MQQQFRQGQIFGATVVKVVTYILTSVTLPAQCLLNSNFGERYLSVPRVFLALVFIPMITDMPDGNLESLSSMKLYNFNYNAIVVGTVIMAWEWWMTRRAIWTHGVPRHSRSCGSPRPFLGPDGKWQRLGLQPALCLAIGGIMSYWSVSVMRYFWCVAVLLLVGWLFIYAALRNRVLDMQDAVIEQKSLSNALQEDDGATAQKEHYGYPIGTAISRAERNNAPTLLEIINGKNSVVNNHANYAAAERE